MRITEKGPESSISFQFAIYRASFMFYFSFSSFFSLGRVQQRVE